MSLRGHRTSIALEQAFWDELVALAACRNSSLASLVAEVDSARGPEEPLASSLRLYVLGILRSKARGL
ncbi:MAG: ribbon-helix-helix domain-containing protein [Pseudomonadota bacterium]